MVVGRLLSYWTGNFSGPMLNFRRVRIPINQSGFHGMSCRKTSCGSEAKSAQWSWALKFCQEMQVTREEDVFLGQLGMHPRDPGSPSENGNAFQR